MPRSLVLCLFLLAFSTNLAFALPPPALPAGSSVRPIERFPVAPHNDVTIEWWYLNANVTTKSGRHLALIGSFFRFGNAQGAVAKDSTIKVKQSHYLIFAVTDIDSKKHWAYSFGDKNTLDLLQAAATIAIMNNPGSPRVQALVAALNQGTFPPPTRLIADPCTVSASPFAARYGTGNSVTAVPGTTNTFTLTLSSGHDGCNAALTFAGVKTPMLVNGDGNTGLRVKTDMKYISLTRCRVTGTVDTGDGGEEATGEGWFDHQWGNSWTTQSAGWDWWGTQLANGTDVLFFRQLDLKTGNAFFPCATFEDSSGRQVTTHHVVFSYSPTSTWQSPVTGAVYPLNWTISFPDQGVTLNVTPHMQDQEMPVLASGGAIWEGACSVDAEVHGVAVPGIAYMELVGYNSPAVRASVEQAAGAK